MAVLKGSETKGTHCILVAWVGERRIGLQQSPGREGKLSDSVSLHGSWQRGSRVGLHGCSSVTGPHAVRMSTSLMCGAVCY